MPRRGSRNLAYILQRLGLIADDAAEGLPLGDQEQGVTLLGDASHLQAPLRVPVVLLRTDPGWAGPVQNECLLAVPRSDSGGLVIAFAGATASGSVYRWAVVAQTFTPVNLSPLQPLVDVDAVHVHTGRYQLGDFNAATFFGVALVQTWPWALFGAPLRDLYIPPGRAFVMWNNTPNNASASGLIWAQEVPRP